MEKRPPVRYAIIRAITTMGMLASRLREVQTNRGVCLAHRLIWIVSRESHLSSWHPKRAY